MRWWNREKTPRVKRLRVPDLLRRAGVLMNRQMLQDHLAQAERQLAEVAARIEGQKAFIRSLERRGQDTAHAAFLLQQSLGFKALNETHRDRLQRELVRCRTQVSTWPSLHML